MNQQPGGNYKDKGFFRRKYPRRIVDKKVGVLIRGQYVLARMGEIGEGGMSLLVDLVFSQGQKLVVSFQIPGGTFVSLQAVVRSIRNEKGRCVHGLSFENIQFSHKRQIRGFVSSRSDSEKIIL